MSDLWRTLAQRRHAGAGPIHRWCNALFDPRQTPLTFDPLRQFQWRPISGKDAARDKRDGRIAALRFRIDGAG